MPYRAKLGVNCLLAVASMQVLFLFSESRGITSDWFSEIAVVIVIVFALYHCIATSAIITDLLSNSPITAVDSKPLRFILLLIFPHESLAQIC